DLLSSKIRTFNNLMIRVPNETLAKSNITNVSYFPIRRIDLNLRVAYDSDLSKVETVLRKVAETHSLCLEDPTPLFLVTGYGESSIDVLFCPWTLSKNFLTVQNDL